MERIESAYTRTLRRVLVLDSRGFRRSDVVDAARAERCRVLTLRNANRARVHLAGSESFDALIIPVSREAEDSLAFANDVRELRPKLPLLFITATTDELEVLEAGLRERGFSNARTRAACLANVTSLRHSLGDLLTGSANEVAPLRAQGQAA